MSVAKLSAVHKLACAIRANLPQQGRECPGAVRVLQVFVQDLPPYRGGMWDWAGQQPFSVLLAPLPEERYHTPDGLLRREPILEAVAERLREVHSLELEQSPEHQYFRALLDQLLEAPLYAWAWTGTTPCSPDPENPDRLGGPAPWRPIKTVLAPVDGKLLDNLVAAAERCWLTNRPPKGKGRRKDKIPPHLRTKPLSIKQAAVLMGYCDAIRFGKQGAKRLKAAMQDRAVAFEKLSRQSYVFSKADFPQNVWGQLDPTGPKSP
jgi:hypothetical protein